MCILELSKVLIYEFYYDYIKNKYNNKSKLLFTETFRNFSNKSKYHDDLSKLVVGKMKG